MILKRLFKHKRRSCNAQDVGVSGFKTFKDGRTILNKTETNNIIWSKLKLMKNYKMPSNYRAIIVYSSKLSK